MAHPSAPEPLDLEGGEEELFGPAFPPNASSRTKQARQAPERRPFPSQGSMLLHEPPPDAIPDIVIEAREELAGACAEAEVVAPTTQDGIELLEEQRQ
jgi:hypothetical protein